MTLAGTPSLNPPPLVSLTNPWGVLHAHLRDFFFYKSKLTRFFQPRPLCARVCLNGVGPVPALVSQSPFVVLRSLFLARISPFTVLFSIFARTFISLGVVVVGPTTFLYVLEEPLALHPGDCVCWES